ncbi:BLUF domain-containing protein [Roseobacter sinensis]|uniref:BLUF domain-containing protein n=1 Tax=Roseobacter sinensis TaxID=2931391 RepID=A0ABT3BF95_9RHOB|nr:BLUF domain-containing protein [Roseobacter sp. WL0113]MCV3272233.1 BLUF domain-containing protein [Roseobacter sp. WL0113]
MSVWQLIYTSRPFGYDLNVLANILATSRNRNARDDITGALICRPDVFLQLLEGPRAKVEATYARICEDDRHVEVTPLIAEETPDRLFPDWAMKHDPAVSWLWSPVEVHMGALHSASKLEVREVFVRSAES